MSNMDNSHRVSIRPLSMTFDIDHDQQHYDDGPVPAQAGAARPEQAEEKSTKANLGNFVRVMKLGNRTDYLLITICFFSGLGAGIAMPLMFLIFGRLVGDFAGYFTPELLAIMPNTPVNVLGGTMTTPSYPMVMLHYTITKKKFMQSVNQNTLYMVYLGLARFILCYISMLCIRICGLRISARLRLLYMKALFRHPVGEIDEISPGTIASRLTTNINTIESGISQHFSLAVQAISFTVGVYIVAFIKSAILTLVASASVPIVIICYGTAVPLIYKYYYLGESIRDDASSMAFEIFKSVRIVMAFGAEGRLAGKHKEILNRAQRADRKNAPLQGFFMAPMFFAVYATFAISVWFGIKLFIQGKIEGIATIVGNVLFCVIWAQMCIFRLYGPIVQIVRAAGAAEEIFAVIDAKVPDLDGLNHTDVSPMDDITFRDITFAYPTRPDTIILNRLNVTFEAGKTTAVVGQSGSGKSTIVGLLQRWYDPLNVAPSLPDLDEDIHAQGRLEVLHKEKESYASNSWKPPGIYIGDVNLHDIAVKFWRCNIGLVQQEPFLFDDTIFNNVAYGLAGTKWFNAPYEEKAQMVHYACQEAFADEFISRLPLGYDTAVGEGGLKLSGGQRQRIAIARAIIKNPPILILDEATSAIDVRTEKIVQKALDRVSKYRTTICIAHRLSTIKKADKIVVIRSGKVVEQGTHDELLANEDGVYTGFVRTQQVQLGKEDTDTDGLSNEDKEEMSAYGMSSSYEKEPSLESHKPQKRKEKQRGFLGSFGKLVYEQKTRWLLYTLTGIGAFAGGTSYPLQAWQFAHVVDAFTKPPDELRSIGNRFAMGFGIQACGVGLAFLVLGWASTLISTEVSSYYRQEYLENLLKSPISFFDREENNSGTLASRLATDTTHLQKLLGAEMSTVLVAVLSIVGSVIISFAYGWKLSLVGVLAVMPVVILAGFFRVYLEQGFERLNMVVFSESSKFGSEAIGAFRTVTSLIMEDVIIERFDMLLKHHVASAVKKARFGTVIFAFSDSADMLCQALTFWYGGKLLADREYDIISFFVIYMAVIQSSLAAGMYFSFSPNIVEATFAANRILNARPAKDEGRREPYHMPHRDEPVGIEFQNVHFTYEDREQAVLNGMSLRIERGQFAAFVGASGSGKSTMISLLERFYEPSFGRILVGGHDISELSVESYRKNLSLVAQESTLYEGTILENLSLSIPESLATNEAIFDACRSAQIHDFIISLPEGYNTQIGHRGVALSGGQRQRLALARALLRRPQLLLLDEATSNLDSASEAQVSAAIERAAGDGQRTVIAVAHRLATVQNADVIFCLGDGRVLEWGTHPELLARRGVYFQMCQAQALDR